MSQLTRFLGGSPIATFVKLAIASFLVGFAMVWLDLRPRDVFAWIGDLFRGLWEMGAESLEYLLLGAMVVVPLFVVMRLLSWRGGRER